MKNHSPLAQWKTLTLGSALSALLAMPFGTPAVAQEPAKPAVVRDTRTKYGMVFVIGYEMDKARADAILQQQDMTKDVKGLVEKLEPLTATKAVTHCSCAAQVLRSGTRCSLDMGASLLEIEPTIGPSGKTLNITMKRTERASNSVSTGSAAMNFGEYLFIGTVPEVKPGKDMLLFMRCVVHFLE